MKCRWFHYFGLWGKRENRQAMAHRSLWILLMSSTPLLVRRRCVKAEVLPKVNEDSLSRPWDRKVKTIVTFAKMAFDPR